MTIDQTDAVNCWLKFLNPHSLKSNLIAASMYLAAWETFEHSVIGHLEGFYMVDFDQGDNRFADEYTNAVLSRDKSRFKASMLWFQESNAIDDTDMALADRARQHRNDIAHKLPAYIAQVSHNVDVTLLGELCSLLNKIDVWWIRNIDMSINPDFAGQDVEAIPDDKIKSGNMLFLTMMFNIAKGDDVEANQYHDYFVKLPEPQP